MKHSVTLPWPSKNLSPNSRKHWGKLAAAKRAYRTACGWAATASGLRRIDADALHVKVTFCPPDNRRRDLDNMLSSFKQGIDAVAEAMGVDDYGFEFHISRRAACQGGCVIVHVVDSEAEEPLVTISEFG